MGALYVTEGSTLGGQLISRHLAQRFGWKNGEGHRFFSCYGAETGRMWASFREELTRLSEPSPEDMIVDGARKMFRTLHNWLCSQAANA